MRDKAILENGGTLKSVPDCYKNQEICNKAVDNYPHTLEFALECYKSQEMCYKAFHRCFFLHLILQETCDIVASLYPFLIVYCADKYNDDVFLC